LILDQSTDESSIGKPFLKSNFPANFPTNEIELTVRSRGLAVTMTITVVAVASTNDYWPC
jgi:hypothetical protein